MENKKIILSVCLIVAMGFAVYANSLKGAFLYDDQIWVQENKWIVNWDHAGRLFVSDIGAGSDRKYNFYRPLVPLTFMIDHSLGKFDVRIYHLTNLFFHIGTALCVYWLVHLLFADDLLALLTGLFFVVHPIHTEAVSYISGRSDPMCIFFVLLALIFYIKELRPPLVNFGLMSVFYILAILSKENAVILPLLILVYHLFFGGFKSGKFSSVLIITFAYAVLRSTVLYFPMAFDNHSTFWERMPGFLVAMSNYTRLLVFPSHLHMEYGDLLFSFKDPRALLGGVILFSIVAGAVRSARRDKLTAFAITWFLVALLPESNIYRINAYMYEHWLYLPSVGFFLILAKYLSLGCRHQKLKIAAVAATVALLSFYSCLTIKQNIYWKDPISFYKRTIQYAPFSARLYNNLALAYSKTGNKEEAVEYFKKALAINPEFAEVYNNLAVIYADTGKIDDAIELYKKAIAIGTGSPDFDTAGGYSNLGNAYGKAGKYEEAIAAFKKAIAINPNLASSYNNLGITYRQLGDDQQAVTLFEKAAKLDTQNVVIRFNLGGAYEVLGRSREAMEEYKEVTRLDGTDAAAYNNIGFILKSSGKNGEAIPFFNTALRYDPRLVQAYENLINVYMTTGRNEEAASVCLKAMQADPSHAGAYNHLLDLIRAQAKFSTVGYS